MRPLPFILLFLFLLQTPVWANPIYVIKEKGGVVRFTNKPPAAGVEAQIFTAKKANFSVFKLSPRARLHKNLYNQAIHSAASEHGLEPGLIKAVIHAESAFDRYAVSKKGARGLMQLMPGTSTMLGVKNPFDPAQNIIGGARYLAFLLRRYDGNIKLALAAYNAGPGAVDEHSGIPPYRETRQYVARVLDLKKRYDKET